MAKGALNEPLGNYCRCRISEPNEQSECNNCGLPVRRRSPVVLGWKKRLKIFAISAGASGAFIATAIFLKNLMIRLWPGWDPLSEIVTDFAIICFAILIFMAWTLFLRLREAGE